MPKTRSITATPRKQRVATARNSVATAKQSSAATARKQRGDSEKTAWQHEGRKTKRLLKLVTTVANQRERERERKKERDIKDGIEATTIKT